MFPFRTTFFLVKNNMIRHHFAQMATLIYSQKQKRSSAVNRMKKDVRWEQRFQNFERAFIFFDKSCKLDTYDELQGAGLVQSFEFTFELAWKTLKDYLQNQGLEVPFPREVIKQAFTTGLLEDGVLWIEMLDKRNELTHTYNQEQAQIAIQTIRNKYFLPIEQVYKKMQKLCLV